MRVAAVPKDFPVPGEGVPPAVAGSIIAAVPLAQSVAGSPFDPVHA